MNRRIVICVVILVGALSPCARGASYTYNLGDTTADYYTDPANAPPGVAQAISDAAGWFANPAHNGDQITILFPSGTYTFNCPANAVKTAGLIDASNINPGTANGVTGRLIFRGAGDFGPSATNLNFTILVDPSAPRQVTSEKFITAENAAHLTFTQFHVGSTGITPDGIGRAVTQGTVVTTGTNTLNGASNNFVVVDVPPGFATPADVYDTGNYPTSGRYMRAYAYVNGVPEEVGTDSQVPWKSYQNVSTAQSPNRWELDGLDHVPTYTTGTVIAIKSKHGVIPVRFTDTNDIALDHLRFTDATEVWFFGTGDKYSYTNCVSDRGDDIQGLTPCLASNGNGITPITTNSTQIYIANNSFTALGDDAIAVSNSTDPIIINNTSSDDFARGIFLSNVTNPITSGNVMIRNITVPAYLPEDPLDSSPTLPWWGIPGLGILLAAFGLRSVGRSSSPGAR